MQIKISDLSVGAAIKGGSFAVRSAAMRKTSTGKPFLSVTLFDGTDTINGNHWDYTNDWVPAINDVVVINAAVTEWSGKKQLGIGSIAPCTEHSLDDFMPQNNLDIDTLFDASIKLLDTIKNDVLRDVAKDCLMENMVQWKNAPGAKNIHNAYKGGALEHCLDTALVAAHIAKAYEGIVDYDLIVAGAFLHDIGKLDTYGFYGINIELTPLGHLHDHIAIGHAMLEKIKPKYDRDINTINLLQHIILSHHGCLEYGSPVVPKFMEAFIVSQADMITSKMSIYAEANKNCKGPVTDRVYGLGNISLLSQEYVHGILVE